MAHSFHDETDVPEEVRQAFERDMETFERTEPTAPLEMLAHTGLELPSPDALSDDQVSEILWRALQGLAFLGVFLHHTDHLSDRELYELLWRDALRQGVVMMPGNPNFGFHLDLIDSGSDEDEQIYLRFYADDRTREHWAEEFSSVEIPPRETPPYDRDRLLPQQRSLPSLAGEAS